MHLEDTESSSLIVKSMEIPDGSLFLGLDSSTQGLKAVVLRFDASSHQLVHQADVAVNYDQDLPHYKTSGGVHRGPDGLTVTAPTVMWIEALDILIDRCKARSIDFNKIVSISGSGQQHGSVYWNQSASACLSSLSASLPLHTQLQNAFSVQNSPIWMDSSTTALCREIEALFPNGAHDVAQKTGSRAYERFTLSQIAKISRQQPRAYEETSRISLVSSFVASLFCGAVAPIDDGDGAGMNLLDLTTKSWVPELLNFGGPNLASKLGEPTISSNIVGHISKYFVDRYGFNPSCSVVAFSGDNPCSLVGLRLKEDQIGVSLGTSDTIFGATRQLSPNANEGHVFCNPGDPSGFLVLLCFKNGSLTREHVRNQSSSGSWQKFSQSLAATPAGNNGKIGIYYLEPEITPPGNPGIFRFNSNDEKLSESQQFSPDEEARAVVESQCLSMLVHSRKLGLSVKSIIATGGASTNGNLIQILSDVFGAPVSVGEIPNSAALGGAFKAFHGWFISKNQDPKIKEQTLADIIEPFTSAFSLRVAATPNPDNHKLYQSMAVRYQQLEQQYVKPL